MKDNPLREVIAKEGGNLQKVGGGKKSPGERWRGPWTGVHAARQKISPRRREKPFMVPARRRGQLWRKHEKSQKESHKVAHPPNLKKRKKKKGEVHHKSMSNTGPRLDPRKGASIWKKERGGA